MSAPGSIQSAAAPPAVEAVPPRAWMLLGFVWFAFFINYCDRQVIFSVFTDLERDLGLNETMQGQCGLVFLWAYGLSTPVAGQLGDWFSKRRLVVVSLVLWSLATLLSGLATGPAMLLMLRGAVGVSEAFFYPAAVALIANTFPSSRRSRALALYGTGQILGTVAGGSFGGYMAEWVSWRMAFYTLGLVGVLYAWPLHRFLRDFPEPRTSEESGPREFSLRRVLRVPTFWVVGLVFCVFVMVQWFLNSWLPKHVETTFQVGSGAAGTIATLYIQGPTFAGMLLGGWSADRLFRKTRAARYWLVSGGLLLAAPWLYLLGQAGSLNGVRIAAAGFGLFSGFLIANIMASAFDVVPARSRASAAGFLILCSCLVAGAGIMLKGRFGFSTLVGAASWAAALAALALMAAIFLLFPRDYRRAEEALPPTRSA
jgi:predicted MFS family arabinose efflux permease